MAVALLASSALLGAQAPVQVKLEILDSKGTMAQTHEGTAVTLRASVSAGDVLVTPGLVAFCDESQSDRCSGPGLLGTAQLTARGIATAVFRLGEGGRRLRAVFAGTRTYARAVSAVTPLTVTFAGKREPEATIATTGSQAGGGGNAYDVVVTVGGATPQAPTGRVSIVDLRNPAALLAVGAMTPAGTTQKVGFVTIAGQPQNCSVGTVAAGDFNHDGKLDLAVSGGCASNPNDASTLTPGAVFVLLGKGDGTFQAAGATTAVGRFNMGLVAGDFNSDGNLDLAVANEADDTVSILLGNGDGTFKPQGTSATGHGPRSVAVGDFNGDGIADLAVVNEGGMQAPFGGTVSILLGNGDGTFGEQKSFGAGPFPDTVAAGDLNGDGVLDLAIGNGGGGDGVSVLLGKGDGTFEPRQAVRGGRGSPLVLMADLNGDGKPELVTSSRDGGGEVAVLLGNGDGSFQAPQVVPYHGPWGVAIGDFNGDGKLDLVVAGGTNSPVVVLPGNGDGTFQTGVEVPGLETISELAVGDFDGDGKADIAAKAWFVEKDPFSIALNRGSYEALFTALNLTVAGDGMHPVQARYDGDDRYRAGTTGTVLWSAQVPPPAVTAIRPNPAPFSVPLVYSEGKPGVTEQEVTLEGSGFQRGVALTLKSSRKGDLAIKDAKVVSASQVRFKQSFAEPGDWVMEVANPDGQKAAPTPFSVVTFPQPAIESITPNPVRTASNPQTITLHGKGFQAGVQYRMGLFPEGMDAGWEPFKSPTFVSDHELRLTGVFDTPTTGDGQIAVQLANPDGQYSQVGQFRVAHPAPAITALEPKEIVATPRRTVGDESDPQWQWCCGSGERARGPDAQTLTIVGTGFAPNAAVTIGRGGQWITVYLKDDLRFIDSTRIELSTRFLTPGTWQLVVGNLYEEESAPVNLVIKAP